MRPALLLAIMLIGCAHRHSEDLLTIRGQHLCWEDDRGETVCLTATPWAAGCIPLQETEYGLIVACPMRGVLKLDTPEPIHTEGAPPR